MVQPQTLEWIEPLELAAALKAEDMVLLYSGVQASYSGRYSYLACDARSWAKGDDFDALAPQLTADRPRWENAWFGYFGYGLKDALETLTPDLPGAFGLPKLCMARFASIYVFDHDRRMLTLWSELPHHRTPAALPGSLLPHVAELNSNMTRAEYLEKTAHIIEHIRAGALYQANLTRKFRGRFVQPPDGFAVFTRLCSASPAPYSAFLRLGGTEIISSSPELFLRISAGGHIATRPIKGSAARHADPARDAASREALAASAKDRAENLMIVDLMRNDLSRSCEAGSVRADALFEVTSHATIHHMSGNVSGQKRADITTLEAIQHAFPPGSMTGAPKIRAMNLCSELERESRGVYSGAIGWLGGDGACELSVVIRTLILQGDRFEFQVGGGIVADSTPEAELAETIEKSRGIAAALGFDADKLAEL